jgi:hypothetical protein
MASLNNGNYLNSRYYARPPILLSSRKLPVCELHNMARKDGGYLRYEIAATAGCQNKELGGFGPTRSRVIDDSGRQQIGEDPL